MARRWIAPYTERMRSPALQLKAGFTLIELMLVVAIIGLLAAIAVPKFSGLVLKSREAAVRGKLGLVRSAVSLYYVDLIDADVGPNIHINHPTLRSGLTPKYIDEVPWIEVPTVPAHASANVSLGAGHLDWPVNPAGPGFCAYRAAFFSDPRTFVLCSHTDSAGHVWSQW